jgi:hypothetical protein
VNRLFTHFTFFVSSKGIIQSENYKSRFHSERPYNSESENSVGNVENFMQRSHISLTIVTKSKLLIIFPNTIHKIQIFCYSLDTFLYTEIRYNKNEPSFDKTTLY